MFKFGKKKEATTASANTSSNVLPAKTEAKSEPAAPPKLEPTNSSAALPLPATSNAPVAAPVATAASPVATATDKGSSAFHHGLVTIKLLETKNLKMPADCPIVPGGPTGKDLASLPFAVIEMDKNEVIVRAVEASPMENTVTFQSKSNL